MIDPQDSTHQVYGPAASAQRFLFSQRGYGCTSILNPERDGVGADKLLSISRGSVGEPIGSASYTS